jgi:biofilm PGA synthesis lipoprotein PgaB
MSSANTSWTTRIGRGAARVSFALLALGLVATPFAVAWHLHTLGLQVSEQHTTPAAVLTPDQLATAAAAGSRLPSRTPPVVLAYHDIRPLVATEKHPDPRANPGYDFVVTPEEFDAQLTALEAAGYTSITSDQYADYLTGGEVPERSVMITFDDGTHGLWTHADKILERHGMHGVSFLITGNVGAKRPYYLSWQEIDRMADSGRWDFQSHTRKMHARMPIDAEGTLASEMVHRRWLFEENRAETLGEFETKIREDLRGSVQDIVDHGLPRPTLFAFPFSEGYYGNLRIGDPQTAAIALAVVREMFVGSFNNAPPQPLPVGARAAAAGMVGRVELTMKTTLHELLTKVRAYTPVTPAQAPPAARTDLWTTLNDSPALVRASGNEVRLLGSGRWQEVAYGRHATVDWASYRGSVTVNGLSVDGVGNASLVARVGTSKEVRAQVSSNHMRLSVGRGSAAVVIGELPLAPGDRHTVAFTVSPTATDVVVDGSARLSAPADGGPGSYGGIGLASSRDVESAPWPVFTDLSITAGEESPNVRSGVGVPMPR